MLTFETARKLINEAIANLDLHRDPGELYEPIRYTLSNGGKRLRPCLIIMAHSLFNDHVSQAIPPALAIELFHNFTLLHDDIMDDSPLRRGKPTVHHKWNRNIAILSGDVMVFIAYEQLYKAEKSVVHRLIPIFNRMAMEVCEGQQYDMNFESKHEVSEAEYLKMIELKTAVLIGSSMQIGAITGGADQTNAQQLYSFGRNLGLAFQLQDDLLDLYGDPEIFGKKIGGDIMAGKKTYLLVKTLERAEKETREKVFNALNDPVMSREEKIHQIKSVYDAWGIRQVVRNKIDHIFNEAIMALDTVDVAEEKKEGLYEMAGLLVNRDC
jgi:geranylgeranyl diphosphate synthase type II